MSWVKNWWVLICIRFTYTTGWSPTATVALSQTTIYMRIGSPSPSIGLLSVLSGELSKLRRNFCGGQGKDNWPSPLFETILSGVVEEKLWATLKVARKRKKLEMEA